MNDDQKQDRLRSRAREVLEAYGSDPARWPENERDALAEVIEQDPLLSAQMADEKTLDDLLALGTIEPPSFALQTRILALRRRDEGVGGTSTSSHIWQQILSVLWPYGSPAIPASALAVALVLGSSLGLLTNVATNSWSDESSYDVVALALGDTVLTEEWQ